MGPGEPVEHPALALPPAMASPHRPAVMTDMAQWPAQGGSAMHGRDITTPLGLRFTIERPRSAVRDRPYRGRLRRYDRSAFPTSVPDWPGKRCADVR